MSIATATDARMDAILAVRRRKRTGRSLIYLVIVLLAIFSLKTTVIDDTDWERMGSFANVLAAVGEFLEVDPPRFVAFTFGSMRVAVTVRAVDEDVEVRLEQTGCAPTDPERAWQHLNCRSCWVYFLTNLKSVLEHGIDLRDRSRPGRNDAVSIGWTPPAPLAGSPAPD